MGILEKQGVHSDSLDGLLSLRMSVSDTCSYIFGIFRSNTFQFVALLFLGVYQFGEWWDLCKSYKQVTGRYIWLDQFPLPYCYWPCLLVSISTCFPQYYLVLNIYDPGWREALYEENVWPEKYTRLATVPTQNPLIRLVFQVLNPKTTQKHVRSTGCKSLISKLNFTIFMFEWFVFQSIKLSSLCIFNIILL